MIRFTSSMRSHLARWARILAASCAFVPAVAAAANANTAPVIAPIGEQTVTAGSTFSYQVMATDSDLPAQQLTFSLDYPGGYPGVTITPGGLLTWTPDPNDLADLLCVFGEINNVMIVRVTDNGSPPMSAFWIFGIHVIPANHCPVIAPIGDQFVNAGSLLTFSVTAIDADSPPQTLTFTPDPSFPPGATLTPAGVFSWTPDASSDDGVWGVVVHVTDNGTPPLSGTQGVYIHVVATNHAPVIAPIGDRSVYAGSLLTFSVTATDTDSPPQTLTFTPDFGFPSGATLTPAGVFSWTPDDSWIGATFGVIVRVADNGDPPRSGTQLTFIHVGGASITGPPTGSVFPVGTAVTFTGTFTDAGSTGPHSADWSFDTIHQPGTMDEAANTVTGSYTFTQAGVYLIRLAVMDKDRGVATASRVDGLDAMIVVYDPNAGFVTGGGWINSPAGACVANPGLAGKANFGFESKYKKGAAIPSGETEFQFKVGALNFHSTSYDWLVIAGARARYKGVGTINGGGGYGFMLTAIDGAVSGGGGTDKFRMKITDQASGALVYDNQLGAAETDDPTTVLGGGSIVIQKTGGAAAGSTASPSAAIPTDDTEGVMPTTRELHQNEPNPFERSTSIAFDLPEPGRVKLTVYDVAGREVRLLVDEEEPAGRHQVEWTGEGNDGARAKPGIFFYRIVIESRNGGGTFKSLKRMALLR